MGDVEQLATETCKRFLTAAQLKAICRYRGFSPPGGGKDELADFVAVRLLEPTGVAAAMASLEPVFLRVLHCLAFAGRPVPVRDLGPVLVPTTARYPVHDHRASFRTLGDGLLNRGIVLLGDLGTPSPGESRYACVGLTLPAPHLPHLPPFPGEATVLGSGPKGADPTDLIRRALSLATAAASGAAVGSEDLAGGLAAEMSFGGGRLTVSGVAATTELLLRRSRELWVERSAPSKRAAKSNNAPTREALSAATHILAHAPEGRGFTPRALEACLHLLGLDADAKHLARFCEDGVAAGMVVRGGLERAPSYAAREAPAEQADEPLAFEVQKDGIALDLERSGLDPLFALAHASRVTARGGRLVLLPSVRRLGQHWEPASRALAAVRAKSKAFDEAAREVERLQGKVTVHTGIVVARVEDVGLRALVVAKLGPQVRELGGAWLALPKAAVAPMLEVARKEGFVPRRVS